MRRTGRSRPWITRPAQALWLGLLAGLTCLPAAAGDASRIYEPRAIHPGSTWALGDFDGDQKLDLVLADIPASAPTPASRKITIVSTGIAGIPLSRNATGERLRVRDLDGDSDRDLVLEDASERAVAVWLNDGSGRFEPADVAEYSKQLSHTDPHSFDSARPARMARYTADQSRLEVGLVSFVYELRVHAAFLGRKSEANFSADYRSSIQARGPPRV